MLTRNGSRTKLPKRSSARETLAPINLQINEQLLTEETATTQERKKTFQTPLKLYGQTIEVTKTAKIQNPLLSHVSANTGWPHRHVLSACKTH